ncbi:porin [Pseudomonas sp. ODNR1LW]|nr:porin [Pseudomonas sp. ODNR1LW]
MKTILLASAAAALFAAPAFAQDAVGSVGVTYANPSVEFAGEDFDADVWTVDGTVALPAADWTVTLNGAVDYTKALGEEDFTGVAAAHLTKMWTSDVRAGAFVAANDIGSGNDPVWTVGAEAQKYLSKATLTGLVAYTTADDVDADIWTVGGDAAFYVMPNLRLNAGVSYNNVDVTGDDVDAWTYGVGAEYEVENTPFSVGASYTRADVDSIDVDTWSLGLRYSFGGGLQARDRAGAGLGVSSITSLLSAF